MVAEVTSAVRPLETAVLFMVFNRPDTTMRVFNAIRKARPSRLYVAADGPRVGREGEAELVQRVRKIATTVDWPCEVKTLFRDQNLGCKLAVSGAITWFFENEEEGIILEDDCLPNDSFFDFCQILLERYRDDFRVGLIAGTNFSNFKSQVAETYLFSRLIQIWGWATWRRAWKKYDIYMKKWPIFKSKKLMLDLGINPKICKYLTNNFDQAYNNNIDTWDYQWSYVAISESLLTVVPAINLVSNIGFGLNATHTKSDSCRTMALTTGNLKYPVVHPEFVVPDSCYDLNKIRHNFLMQRIVDRVFDLFNLKFNE